MLFVVLVFFVVLAIGLAVWWFSADQKARRAMKSVPLMRVDQLQPGGKVRVAGRAELIQPAYAPLTGRPCAYWRVVVRERRGGSRNRHWKTIIDEHGGADFFVHCLQSGARALVRPLHVHPLLVQDGRFSSGFLNDAMPHLDAFLAQRGYSSEGLLFNKTMEYREGIVEQGELVAVMGLGHHEHDASQQAQPGPGYRGMIEPKRVVITPPHDGPMILSDEPKLSQP